MQRYILSRLASGLVTIWVIVTLAFAIVRAVPGDPAEILLGDYATPELVAALRKEMGLDRPLLAQYGRFLRQILEGDLGRSLQARRPVVSLLLQQYPYTVWLATLSVAVSSVAGVALGASAALRRNSVPDLLIMIGVVLWISTPSFWLGLLLLVVFSAHLGWFPLAGAGDLGNPVALLGHLILPAAALGARGSAVVARLTRSSVLAVLGEDYVRTARAKGLPNYRVVTRHVLRSGSAAVMSIIGVETISLIGGAVVIETVFSRPGVGRLLVEAASARDYPMIQGAIFFIALAVVVVNLLTDIAYGVLDPRVRFE